MRGSGARPMTWRLAGRAAVAAAFLCVVAWGPAGAREGPEDPGGAVPSPKVHEGRWGAAESEAEIPSGSVVAMSGGRTGVLVQAEDRVEIWVVGADESVVDTGHVRWLGDGRTARVEWEQGKREDFAARTGGNWPWRATGERHGAFRLSDWLIARDGPVGLPFLGGESVGFSLARGGTARVKTKDGRDVEGRWWWSRGLLHVRLPGFREVATYEWRSLARHVGWSASEQAASTGEAVRRSAPVAPEPPVARTPLPEAAPVCRRDVLGALLRTAVERSDVVSAFGIEEQVILLCRDRQKLVVEIVEAEKRLAEVLEQGEEDEAPAPPPPVAVRTVAQLAAVEPARPEPAPSRARAGAGTEGSDKATAPDTREAPPPGGIVERGREAWSWFSLLGREGRLVAGVTDGSGAWFVSVGDEVPGAGVVREISARPPGVEVAGLGLLRWAEKPPAAGARPRGGAGRGDPASERSGAEVEPVRDEALDRAVRTVLGRRERQAAAGGSLTGRADVVDGDTLRLGETRIRLWGIDAPERKQTCVAEGLEWDCGVLAVAALRSRVTRVACREKGRDGYGRVLAVCFSRGEDVNGWMVSEGWALAYRRYGRDYVGREQAAKAARKGIHRGAFVAPWAWRRGERLSAGAGPGSVSGEPAREGGGLPPLPGRGRR